MGFLVELVTLLILCNDLKLYFLIEFLFNVQSFISFFFKYNFKKDRIFNRKMFKNSIYFVIIKGKVCIRKDVETLEIDFIFSKSRRRKKLYFCHKLLIF